jgi:hypothetical protein
MIGDWRLAIAGVSGDTGSNGTALDDGSSRSNPKRIRKNWFTNLKQPVST